MKTTMLSFLAIATLLTSAVFVDGGRAKLNRIQRAATPVEITSHDARISEAYGKLPLSFEANRGQTDSRVDFLTRGGGYTFFLSRAEAVLELRADRRPAEPRSLQWDSGREKDQLTDGGSVVRMQIVGAAAGAAGSGRDQLAGTVNSFVGNEPAAWVTNVPTYARVVYSSIYRGVDLVYHGDGGRLEFDFVIEPDADPGAIGLRYSGADKLHVDADGNLVLMLRDRELRQTAPSAYQTIDGERRVRSVSYRLDPDGVVGFDVGEYDLTVPLVIDPVLAYSTYLGGSGEDAGRSLAVDASGSAYVAGDTASTNFPVVNSAQPYAGGTDVFIAKLNPFGSALLYSTFIGGGDYDVPFDVAIDAAGDAYVTGYTQSTDFPTSTPFQSGFAGGVRDAFVTKVSPTGNALLYSTYLGGSADDEGRAISVDAAANAYVSGATRSSDFPTLLAFQSGFAGLSDAFLTKLNSLGNALLYSTYVGGSAEELADSIAVDAAGNAYAAGFTLSTDFPTASAFQSAPGGGFDGFVLKLGPLGNALVYSTYLGGTMNDAASGIIVDASGSSYVTGFTESTNFPTLTLLQPVLAGTRDAFVTKLNPLGNGVVFSTYLGGSGVDAGFDIALDATGGAFVTGDTQSNNFPTVNAFQPVRGGGSDAFVANVNPLGSALVYSSYLGGSAEDGAEGIAVDSAGDAYVTGFTGSTNYPATVGVFQSANAGSLDAIVAKIGLLPGTVLCTVTLNEGGWIIAANGDMATFNGVVMTDAQGVPSGHESYLDHGPAQPMRMDSTTIFAVTCSDDRTTASIFGQGTIDGLGNHAFRIDMVDGSQSGAADRYGITLDNGYASGLQPLGGGNIVIH